MFTHILEECGASEKLVSTKLQGITSRKTVLFTRDTLSSHECLSIASSTTALLRLSKMSSWSSLFLARSMKRWNSVCNPSQPDSTDFWGNCCSAHCFSLMSTVVLNVPGTQQRQIEIKRKEMFHFQTIDQLNLEVQKICHLSEQTDIICTLSKTVHQIFHWQNFLKYLQNLTVIYVRHPEWLLGQKLQMKKWRHSHSIYRFL